MTQRLTVNTSSRHYPIYIGDDVMASSGALLRELLPGQRAIIIADSHTAPLFSSHLSQNLEKAGFVCDMLSVPAGEASKSFACLQDLLNTILDLRPDRRTALIAVGGGVVGDLTGLCASLILRGVPFVQVPTSLLASVDSSVGGKTGINSRHGKNLIGAFYQPHAVLIDTTAYASLPLRERYAGYAEVAKYGLINQPALWQWLQNHGKSVLEGETNALSHAIKASCQAKADVVTADEREQGQRALLNLGHTFGHALEGVCGFSERLLHGEAVAFGCRMAADLSMRLDLLSADDAHAINKHFNELGYPATLSTLVPGQTWDAHALLTFMGHDKKNIGHTKRLVLLHGIGKAVLHDNVTDAQIMQTLEAYVSV